MYYISNVTGNIISDGMIRVLDYVYGENGVSDAVKFGTIRAIDDPSVIDCIRHGTGTTALIRYRELHQCTLREARNGVDQIKKDMKRFADK